MGYYKDLREHIQALEAHGKLVRIKREINKDTELMPLVRWQFRGLPETERKAFLFENVVDARSRKYNIPVLVASHAASREVYAIGLMCKPEDIMEKWAKAQMNPIEPSVVKHGPAHEEVHMGKSLLEHGGLDEFPVPISTPGWDNAPYLTCANWITKDPELGISNIGNYRAMIKSQTRTGIECRTPQDLRSHWEKCRQAGIPLQAAIVIGAIPAIGLTGASKFPYEVDEFAAAGGIAGEPIELVKCKTIDLEVPATAEIVIEGEMPTDFMEREGPMGEDYGYVGEGRMEPYFDVTCITHRRNAIYNAFISQFPPAESSKLKQLGSGATLYKFLRYNCGLPVLEVAYNEDCDSIPYCVMKIKKARPSQTWQVLNAAAAQNTMHKFLVVVDEDIDIHDPNAVNWALSWCVQPHRDIRIIKGMLLSWDPSAAPPEEFLHDDIHFENSAIQIDATRKWPYLPISLPKKEFMERARQIWEEEGLPKLNPRTPWHGYSLGNWAKEYEEEAELALRGEHYQTGEKLTKGRFKL